MLPWSHLELEFQIPATRAWYESIAQHRTLVRYDGRGTGLSDKNVRDFSLDSMMLDLLAVIEATKLERFELLAIGHGTPIALVFAGKHSHQVSRLILWASYARGADFVSSPRVQALRSMLEKDDWELFTQAVSHSASGWSSPDESTRWADLMKRAVDLSTARRFLTAVTEYDATEHLSAIECPVLLIQRRGLAFPAVELTRQLATALRDAELVMIEGSGIVPSVEDLPAIPNFIPNSRPDLAAFRTVLFTDLVGHTEMMSRLGDEAGRAVLREHETITRNVLKEHGGTEVKTMGDGFMASFGSVTKAVECAIALQRAFAERDGEPLSVRVGLNAGEPIEEDGDLFGATVILASRIAAKADGGEILVADTVRGLCSGKGFLFADRGDFVAKGFEDPVRINEVRWRDE